MSEPDPKAAHRALVEAALAGDDPAAIEPFLASGHVLHQSIATSLPPGRGGAVWAVEKLRTSFGQVIVQIEDQIAAGDRCFTRIVAQVKHTGRLAAARPTGRWLTLKAMVISRYSGGKIEETWVQANDFDLLRQLRAIELPETRETDAAPGPAPGEES